MTVLTQDHWTKLSFLIRQWWPATDFKTANSDAYFAVLQEFPAEIVEAAIKAQLEHDQPFAPSCAQILASIREVQSEPTPGFEAVYGWCRDAAKRWSSNERIALHWLMTQSELAAGWVAEYDWRRFCHEPVDGDYGGAILHRMERSWNAYVERQQQVTRTERALEGIGRGGRQGGLRRSTAACSSPLAHLLQADEDEATAPNGKMIELGSGDTEVEER